MFILIDMQIAATQLATSKTFEYRGRGRWIAGTTRIARQRRWKHKSWQIIAKLFILIMVVMILVINEINHNFIIDKHLCWCSFFLISTERQKRLTWWTRFMLFFPCSVIILVRKHFYSNFKLVVWLVFSFFSFFWLLLRLVLHCIVQFVVLGTRSWNQKL